MFLITQDQVVSPVSNDDASSSASTFNVDAPSFIPRMGMNVSAPSFTPGQPVVISPVTSKPAVISAGNGETGKPKKGKPAHKIIKKGGGLMTISRNKPCVQGSGCEEKSSCPYYHPGAVCKYAANCKFGRECLYEHPERVSRKREDEVSSWRS
jgi:hypothetical protein